MTSQTLGGLFAAFAAFAVILAPAAIPALGPAAVAAVAADPSPGDRIRSADGQMGTVDSTGSVTWDNTRAKNAWGTAPRAEDVLADGGQLIRIAQLGE